MEAQQGAVRYPSAAWAQHAALARQADPHALSMHATAQQHTGSGLCSHALPGAAATAPEGVGLRLRSEMHAGGEQGVDEFGLDEEHFFVLSSSEEPASALGWRSAAPCGSPMRSDAWDTQGVEEGPKGQLPLACGAGGTGDAAWDAADILVPPSAESHISYADPCPYVMRAAYCCALKCYDWTCTEMFVRQVRTC